MFVLLLHEVLTYTFLLDILLFQILSRSSSLKNLNICLVFQHLKELREFPGFINFPFLNKKSLFKS